MFFVPAARFVRRCPARIQVNVLIPTGTSNGSATLTALQGGTSVATGAVTVATVAPGLFGANADATGVGAGYVQ